MKPTTLALAAFFCASTSFAVVEHKLNSAAKDAPLDVTDSANWTPVGFASDDRLIIENSYGHMGSGQTLNVSQFVVYGNAGFTMDGTGSSVIGNKSGGNWNTSFGINVNSDTFVNILGNNNVFTIDTGNSAISGNVNSLSGTTLIRIHSNSMDESAKNHFNVSGAQWFSRLSYLEGSTAKNTISIGDNSVFKLNTILYLAGETGDSNSTRSGENSILMNGNGSLFDASATTVNIGNKGSGNIAGGALLFDISGSQNGFKAANLQLGGEQTLVSGGKIDFKVRGGGNSVNVTGHTIFGKTDNTAGIVGMSISGSNNIVTLNTVRAYGAVIEISGATNKLSTKNFEAYENTKIIVRSGGSLELDSASLYMRTGSSMELYADATGFVDANGNARIKMTNLFDFNDGTLMVDFASYVLQDTVNGDRVLLISAGGDGIDKLLADERAFVRNAILGEAGFYKEGNNLYVHITGVVPEPSACAAIFGAFALAFAAYRRRK